MGIFKVHQVEYDDEVHAKHELVKIALIIGVIALIVFLILKFVGGRSEVIGHSMEPTLHDGESVWMNKIALRIDDPKRYDIVIFPYDDDEFYIKRVIGLPGETVYIDKEGKIYVGDETQIYVDDKGKVVTDVPPLAENYGDEAIKENMRGIAEEPVTLKLDEFFVLGDNRNNSQDSRAEEIGPVARAQLTGKCSVRLWPITKIGPIDHKKGE